MDALIQLSDVTKSYDDDDGHAALEGVSLRVGVGEAVAIMGLRAAGSRRC